MTAHLPTKKMNETRLDAKRGLGGKAAYNSKLYTMTNIHNFKFRTNVTLEAYTTKSEASACLSRKGASSLGKNKMAFYEQTVTVSDFLTLAVDGHAFCPIFQFDTGKKYWIESNNRKYLAYPTYRSGDNAGGMKLSFKKDDFFAGTQTIFVDVDYTRYDDIQVYIDELRYKPTCVYMSFSDGKEKNGVTSRRFHMVYIFDQQLNKEEFLKASRTLTSLITGEF